MTLSVKKSILLFVLLMPFVAQQFNAHQWSSSILSSIFFIFIFLFSIAIVVKNDKKRISFLLKLPITIIILLFIISQMITMITANNNIELFRMAFVAFLFKIFIIIPTYIFNFRINDLLKYKKLIFSVFYMIIVGSLLTQIDYIEKIVTGIYYGIASERFGWKPLHSLMPIANSLAPYLLFFFLTFMIVYKNRFTTFIMYILVILTANRISMMLFTLIYLRQNLNFKKILIAIAVIFSLFTFFGSYISTVVEEASFSNQEKIDMVPRLHYTLKSLEVFDDYPVFGIGLRRFSTETYWIKENYFWQKTYAVQTEFINEVGYKMDFAVSDTGLIFLAEIGIVGTFLLFLFFSYLFHIGKVVNNDMLKPYVIAGLMYLYNITDPFNTYVFGLAFWFVVGIFLNEYYLIKHKKGNQ